MITRAIAFFRTGIWEMSLKDRPAVTMYAIRCVRVVMLAIRTYMKHDCSRIATVLTYYSLLNVVPLVAVVFAMAKGFGLKKVVVKQIADMADKAHWQANVTDQIIGFADSVLNQAKGGIIAGVGVVLLLWTVISILGKIEDSFNTIWEVKRPRTLVRKFTDYLAIMILAPVLLAISSSVTIAATGQIKVIVQSISLLGMFSSFIFLLLKLLPYFTIWFLLTALYLIMPNERIPVRSGILGAVVAGTLFQIVQWVYIKFQIGVASQGAIYGSFAALPLFLGWLQTSWMIMLFGAEIASAGENEETFGFHPDYSRLSDAQKKILLLRIFHLIVKRFAAGEKPATAREIAHNLEIPFSFVREMLADLALIGLVAEIAKGVRKDASFQPALSIEDITIKKVLDAYENRWGNTLPEARSDESKKISLSMQMISEAMAASSANVKLKDI
ncbi:MAG TPA: YhjD/YihY/BrkB family envelope integrity protein [Syntrophorhabdaceae bacterium]|nr:YhjD/YihY/BrkB family envelope integrity protein [Syntrophorhabdaceae bacterium]